MCCELSASASLACLGLWACCRRRPAAACLLTGASTAAVQWTGPCGPCEFSGHFVVLGNNGAALGFGFACVYVTVWSKRAPAPADKRWLASVADMPQRHRVCCLCVCAFSMFLLGRCGVSSAALAARSSTGATSSAIRRACADPRCYHFERAQACRASADTLRYHRDELGPDFVLSLHRLSMALQRHRGATTLPYHVLCLDVSCWVAAGSARVSLVIHNSPLDMCRSTCYMRWRETPLVLRIYSPTRFRACVSLLQWRSASAGVAHGRWCTCTVS